MDNELMVFQNPEFGEIRTAEENGRVLFCGNDVAVALGYGNPRTALASHCKGVQKLDGVDLEGRRQKMSFIPESDVWRLIIRSNLPSAEKFEAWIMEEVLPSINHTGGYSLQPQKQMTPAELLAAQANLLVEQEKRISAIEQKVDRALTAMARPEADTWTADMKEAIRVYCEATGLTDAMGRGRLYAALDREAKCSTDARLRRMRDRKKKAGETRRNYMALTKLDAIAADGKLRAAFEGIVARETARAAVK